MSGLQRYIRTTLIGGMLVVLPLFVFVNLLLWFATWVGGKTAPAAGLVAADLNVPIWLGQTLTIGTILIGCFALGAIVRTRFGNRAFNWLERNTVQRVPGYRPVKEIVGYLGKRDQNPFSRPVIVDVGGGVRLTGFLMDEGAAGPTVFVPTGPNPTTGLILHVGAEQVRRMTLPSSDVVKSIISCGAGSQRLLRSILRPGAALEDSAPSI